MRASEIAKYVNGVLVGQDIEITNVSTLSNPKKNSLIFINKTNLNENEKIEALYLIPSKKKIDTSSVASYIKVNNPRLEFARILKEFFFKKFSSSIDVTSSIGQNVKLGKNVYIGKFSIISDDVEIGDNTIIKDHVVIEEKCIIGNNCYIKSGSVIGEEGFGFEFDENNTPIRIPHVGKVIIGNNVEVGSNNTIARGTIDDTVVHDYVKLDDHVHIAHNCNIGSKTIITACAEISGSVIIGENCWIGPNASIMQKVILENNVTIGLGTIITKNVQANKKIMCLAGLELKKLIQLQKRINFGK